MCKGRLPRLLLSCDVFVPFSHVLEARLAAASLVEEGAFGVADDARFRLLMRGRTVDDSTRFATASAPEQDPLRRRLLDEIVGHSYGRAMHLVRFAPGGLANPPTMAWMSHTACPRQSKPNI